MAIALSHHAVVTPRLRGDGIATDAARANQELAGVHWRERDSHGDDGRRTTNDDEAEGRGRSSVLGWDSM